MHRPSRASIGATTVALVLLAAAACARGTPTAPYWGAIYNATYVGPGTVQRDPRGWQRATPESTTVTLSLSQISADFSGTLVSARPGGTVGSSGSIAGTVTGTGGTFTIVQSGCAGTLHGSFTVANGALTGSATGRDCNAGATGDDARITFTDLIRQP